MLKEFRKEDDPVVVGNKVKAENLQIRECQGILRPWEMRLQTSRM